MWEFLTSWYFFGICAVLLVMLIGVFIFLRSRGTARTSDPSDRRPGANHPDTPPTARRGWPGVRTPTGHFNSTHEQVHEFDRPLRLQR